MGLESNKHNWEASACICMTARSIFANRRGKSPKRHVPYMFHICLYMFSDVAASPMTYPCIFWSHVPNVSIPRGIFHLLGHLLGPQNGDPFVKCRPSNDRWRDRREGAKKKRGRLEMMGIYHGYTTWLVGINHLADDMIHSSNGFFNSSKKHQFPFRNPDPSP